LEIGEAEMSKRRSKHNEDDVDENDDAKNRAQIVSAKITARASIIVAIIGLTGVMIAAIINLAGKKDNLLPTTFPASTSVDNMPATSSVTKCVYPPRYGFECGQYGWEKTSFTQNQAIQSVTATQFTDNYGAPSKVLALTVDFTGAIGTRREQNRVSGEAQVDLSAFPPAGFETKSVNLRGLTVVAWVWASKGAVGDPSHKNGIQLFVKDESDKNCYGAWKNIDQEEVWFQVRWQEDNAALCDSGFNSSKPKLFGVKIAVGDNSIWTTNDLLTFYVDDVDWQSP
jgi:hypothetical protein